MTIERVWNKDGYSNRLYGIATDAIKLSEMELEKIIAIVKRRLKIV